MKKIRIAVLALAVLLIAGAVMAAQTALNTDSFINVLLSGYFKVGNGTPGQTLDAEDAYVEGTLEVDDVLYSDAGLMIPDDIDLIFGNGSDVSVQYDEGTSDRLTITTAGASGVNMLTGNLFVGNGSPAHTPDGEDAYIEGFVQTGSHIYAGDNLYLGDDKLAAFGAGNDAYFWYDETTDDLFKLTLASATGGLQVQTGNLFIGNGTPDQTINGEDAYIEGLVEFDGVGYLDGGAKLPDDMTLTLGTGNDATLAYDETTTDRTLFTSAAASGLNVLTGNLWVGNGTPGTAAMDGEDLYCEGASEFDGTMQVDGIATFAAQSLFNLGAKIIDDQALTLGTGNDATLAYDETTTDRTLFTSAAASGLNVLTGNLWVGNGTPGTAAMDGEDLYCEGASEFDGAMQVDGAATFGVAASFVAGINTTTTASFDITTNSNTRKRLVAPIGYASATEFQTGAPFSAFTSVGIEGGGAGVTGAADSFLSLGDAADSLILGMQVPELATLGAAGDLEIEFDLIEDTDEECNLDVRIFEYGNNVAIVTDTITMANGAARAWQDLDTLATGIGALVDVSDYLIIEITANADTDNFKIYGARVTYSAGVENNVN